MKWRFLIWPFLLGILSAPSVLVSQTPSFLESFEGLHFGMTYKEVDKVLLSNLISLKEEKPDYYNLSIPIYKLLKSHDKGITQAVDVSKERIYYNNEIFFDLKAVIYNDTEYQLIYEKPYYMVKFKSLEIYKVPYANRLNPLFYSLRLKFFHNNLYAIEYKANLSYLEFNRLQNNYYTRYGRVLTPGDQVVEKDGVKTLIHVDGQNISMVRVSLPFQGKIFMYLDKELKSLTTKVYDDVQKQVKEGQFSQYEILEHKKQELRKSLKNQFHYIDAL